MNRREFIELSGGVLMTCPSLANAQQPRGPSIGFLSGSSLQERAPLTTAFGRGLADAGYIAEQNVHVGFRGAEGAYERLPDLAAELVRRQVAVIVTGDAPSTAAAKAATSKIPIVFAVGADPIKPVW